MAPRIVRHTWAATAVLAAGLFALLFTTCLQMTAAMAAGGASAASRGGARSLALPASRRG